MIISKEEIRGLLSQTYPNIEFLETDEATTGRYSDKDIIVFEYENIAGERAVLKFFSLQKLEAGQQESEKQSLLEEFRLIKRFGGHRHVVRAHDVGELRHQDHLVGFYVTMEKFEFTLKELMEQKGTFSEEQVEAFLQQMNQALQLAHYELPEPIVHSDIKPGNIGVRPVDAGGYEYALMDFDVSVDLQRSEGTTPSFTLSNKASMRGLSPVYAPPEQIMAYLHKSGNISNRVDVYAVGAVALEMLTGIAPQKQEDKVYYRLPISQAPKDWQPIFSLLCNPNPKQRAKKVEAGLAVKGQELPEQEPLSGGGQATRKVDTGGFDDHRTIKQAIPKEKAYIQIAIGSYEYAKKLICYLDGESVGDLKEGGKELIVEPGIYNVWVVNGKYESKKHPIRCSVDKIKKLEVFESAGFLKAKKTKRWAWGKSIFLFLFSGVGTLTIIGFYNWFYFNKHKYFNEKEVYEIFNKREKDFSKEENPTIKVSR